MVDLSKNICGCHVYQCTIDNRTLGKKNCPFCSHRKLCPHNNLLVTYPTITNEWDYVRNNNDNPENYAPCSNKMAWWVCPMNPCGCHVYQAPINQRTSGKLGCPFCASKQLCPHYNLRAIYPDIAAEWDYNGNADVQEVNAPHSKALVLWKCVAGKHESYRARISHRTKIRGSSCPTCNKSKGEKYIGEILNKMNISHETEWKHSVLLSRRYDFKFELGGIKHIIEYDGI